MAAFNTVYVWIGASGGDWSDNVHNWNPGYPVASPPSYGDLAIFNNGVAETVAGSGAASEADVVLGTTLTIMDSLSLDGAVSGVGLMVDSGGKVIVGSGATKPGVPAPGDVSVDVIGFTGAGALDVGAGGGLDDTGMVLGDRSTGSGTLTVEGTVIVAPAAAPNGLLIVGNAGSGVVTVQNGGALSAVVGTVLGLQSGSNGTATLTGAGSTWLAGALTVGSAGTGSITVRDGGVLTTTGGSFIGVDDAASGVHGTGSLTIEADGTLNALTSLGIGSLGTFLVNDGTASAGAITLSGGTVVVSNAGTVTTQSLTMAGGTATIESNVIGANSTLMASTLQIGGNGNSGTGIVKVNSGGFVIANTFFVETHGTLKVNGTGSLSGPNGVFVNGLFDISGSDGVSVSALAGMGLVTLGDSTLDVTGGSALPFSGVMLGTGGLTKSGPGTLTLTGANTYTGVTHVTGGSLAISGAATQSKSLLVIVESGATLAGNLTLGAAANTFTDRGHFTGRGHMGLGNDHFTGSGNNGVQIFGDGGNDVLSGGAFRDLFDGGAGKDTLIGGGGADTLTGGVGNDTLSGGKGNDRLIGGVGIDTLTGGANNDVFVFNAPRSAANRDVIKDFNHIADTFYIENAVFTHLGAGVHALASGMLRLGTKALDGNDFLIYNKATGVLSYDHDANGAGAAITIATLTNKPTLAANDFLVI